MLIETLKNLILDFQSQDPETGISRRLNVTLVPGKAFECAGVRGSGKSTLLFQLIKDLLAKGVNQENFLYLDFQDDRLHELKHGDLDQILEAYYSLYPRKKKQETLYCFLDEVGEVAGWELFVDRVLREEEAEVFLTGSSPDRSARELFPFSFREFLDYKEFEPEPLTTRTRLLIQQYYQEFWNGGGFPAVLEASERSPIEILQEMFKTILHRDVIERFDVNHPRAVSEMAYWMINRAASLYSINSLTGYLKSMGFKLSKTFVRSCMEYFEEAYFLFSVKIFAASSSRQKVNPRKIYAIDHALIRAVSTGVLVHTGHLLENLVFLQLRRINKGVCYYRTRSGKEVDFIWMDGEGRPQLIQVAETLVEPKTRKREIQALAEAMQELQCPNATLVTQQETESLTVKAGRIEVVPVWRLMLVLNQLTG